MLLAHKLRSLLGGTVLRQPYGSFMLLWMFVGAEADRRSLQKKKGFENDGGSFSTVVPFLQGRGHGSREAEFPSRPFFHDFP
ncbi:unnamed protein product [Calypogeia fissa]